MKGALIGFLVMLALGAGSSAAARFVLVETREEPSPPSAPLEHPVPTPQASMAEEAPSSAVLGLQVSLQEPEVEAREVTIGPPMAFPPDTIAFIESGCSQCDGPPEALYRVRRIGEGPVEVEAVFDVPNRSAGQEIVRYEFDVPGGGINAAVCTRGYCGGLGVPTPDAEVSIFHSSDYGETWQAAGVFRTQARFIGTLEQGFMFWLPQEQRGFLLPGGNPIAQPSGLGRLFPRVEGGRTWWSGDDRRFYDSRGQAVTLAGETEIGSPEQKIVEGGAIYSWVPRRDRGSPFTAYLTILHDDFEQTFQSDSRSIIAGFLDDRFLLLAMGLGPLEDRIFFSGAVLDTQTATLHPVPELADRRFGRTYLRAVYRGPFPPLATVAGIGEGGCLGVHVAPRLQSAMTACLTTGSTVEVIGQVRRTRGQDWLSVVLPDGRTGWALSAHLAR